MNITHGREGETETETEREHAKNVRTEQKPKSKHLRVVIATLIFSPVIAVD